MAHFLFNVSDGDRERASAQLRAKIWGVGPDEAHRDALAAGDLALIYVSAPRSEFIGRAELATAVHQWTPAEAAAYPGEAASGVLLADVDEWDRPVSMDAVVQRIDPTASNPLVQTNARIGFTTGVVRITVDEYDSALAAARLQAQSPSARDTRVARLRPRPERAVVMPMEELDFSVLPESLRDLAPLISRYAESDDVERSQLLERASDHELRELCNAPTSRWNAINAFLDAHVAGEPGRAQDVALALDSFAQAAMEARLELSSRG